MDNSLEFQNKAQGYSIRQHHTRKNSAEEQIKRM